MCLNRLLTFVWWLLTFVWWAVQEILCCCCCFGMLYPHTVHGGSSLGPNPSPEAPPFVLLHYVAFLWPSKETSLQEQLLHINPRPWKKYKRKKPPQKNTLPQNAFDSLAACNETQTQCLLCKNTSFFYWICIITIAHNQFEQSKIFIEIH